MSITKYRIQTNGMYREAKLVATSPFAEGEILESFANAQLLTAPTYQSIQVSRNEHILEDNLANLNHSCDPTTLVDTVRGVVIARRNIAVGEELTFFYPSTEWAMIEPFACHCGSPDCIGQIRGAKFLSPDQLDRYFLNPHILALRGETTKRPI